MSAILGDRLASVYLRSVCGWQGWVDATPTLGMAVAVAILGTKHANILAGRVAVGVTIAGAFLLYVTRPSVCLVFGAKSN